MLTPGDIVTLDLGAPAGAEAGLRRTTVVITAGQILRGGPNVIQVVPLARTMRDSGAEVVVEPDEGNGLRTTSAAQCQHIRPVALTRVRARLGNVGPVVLRRLRETVALIIDAGTFPDRQGPRFPIPPTRSPSSVPSASSRCTTSHARPWCPGIRERQAGGIRFFSPGGFP